MFSLFQNTWDRLMAYVHQMKKVNERSSSSSLNSLGKRRGEG
jgi:hypothetical protein